jgi:hypothetical protein
VQCGDADAEENENRVYEAGQWPASATVSVDALRLRGAGSASASATGSSPTSTAGSSGNVGGGGGGLSTAAKAAIGTVIPLVFVLGALALLVLWRRRKHKKAALALAKINMVDEKPAPSSSTSKRGSYHQPYAQQPALDSKTISIAAAATAGVGRTGPNTHEIPEWNVEMDATDAERQRLVPQDPLSATSNGTEASELGGIARMPRKPIAPVELDGTSARAEVGDAYLPYRPGAT